tara:strand:+ start:232 stop:516 length:285 start_codon:yes stop_codon:yes gene_type:complete
MIEPIITVSKEMKEALQYALSDTRSPMIMRNYLIERFQDEAIFRRSWECLYTSKNYIDIIRNYEVIERRFGCIGEFTGELNRLLRKYTSEDWGF